MDRRSGCRGNSRSGWPPRGSPAAGFGEKPLAEVKQGRKNEYAVPGIRGQGHAKPGGFMGDVNAGAFGSHDDIMLTGVSRRVALGKNLATT